MSRALVAVVCSVLALAALERPCEAQPGAQPNEGADTTDTAAPQKRAAAARSFAEGQQAYEARDFVHAGESFERAYEEVPHHGSLWNAARSWQKAGQHMRAANLCVRFLREAPAGAPQRAEATEMLRELAVDLVRLEVHLSAGLENAQVDGVALAGSEYFVQPGEHEVIATGTGQARKIVTASAGQTVSVILDAPSPPPPVIAPPAPPERPRTRIAPRVFIGGAALTLTSLGFTIVSGLDTLSKRDAFLAHRNQSNYDAGASAQTRTNVLIAVTGGLAIVTGVLTLLFLDADRSPRAAASAAAASF